MIAASAMERWRDADRREAQRERFAHGLSDVYRGNAFYRRKLDAAGFGSPLGINAQTWANVSRSGWLKLWIEMPSTTALISSLAV